jgi:CRISPR type I-E-associated protein CasA/Cse1
MPPSTQKWDLTSMPWIAVVDAHGQPATMSIRDVLTGTDAPARRLAGEPPVRAAILRLLMAVLHDALKGPADDTEWARWWTARTWPTKFLAAYLDANAPRMCLFDPDNPFMQTPTVAEMTRKTIADIVTHRPAGNNPIWLSHNTGLDGVAPLALTPGEAAGWVLAAHQFARPGLYPGPAGRGSVTQSVLTNRHVTLPTGRNLTETLLLNLTPYTPDRDDVPPWRESPTAPPLHAGPPAGLVQLLTWRTRLILLEPALSVTECVQAADPSVATEIGSAWLHSHDPHLAFRPDRKDPAILWPLTCDPTRAVWRTFGALLDGPGNGSAVAAARRRTEAGYLAEGEWSVTVAGVAMEAKAKPVAWHFDTLPPVPPDLVQAATDIASVTGSALRKACGVALQELGASTGGDAVGTATSGWWRSLNRPAQTLLTNLAAAHTDPTATGHLLDGWAERLRLTAAETVERLCQPYPPHDSLRATVAGRRVLHAVIAKGKPA